MDPDENLKQTRTLIDVIFAGGGSQRTAEELADLVRDLDVWLSKGGFLPGSWVAINDGS